VELAGAPRDTSREIERRVIRGLRELGPEGRLLQTMALCRATSELVVAGIRLREGALAAHEVRVRLARLRYGNALVDQVEAYRARRAR
jgi:hypothetical protein